jgi:hypothetical protein
MDNLIFDTLNLRVYPYRIIPDVYKSLMAVYEIEKDLPVTTEAPTVITDGPTDGPTDFPTDFPPL